VNELPLTERKNEWARTNGVSDRVNFVYAGTLGLKHNPQVLLALAEALVPLNAVVTVVSEGRTAEWLQEESLRRSVRNVKVLPFQSFEQMPEVLGAGDVLIALLEREAGIFSVPSKILTYLCAGRPVLAGVPGNNLATRIIREAGAGICVEPGDVSGFVDAGRRLALDDAARERMGKAGRAYAEREFEIGRIADRFERIVEEAMQECKTPQRS
jgi:glycosyltransferase involved in cell wall biosynthesis